MRLDRTSPSIEEDKAIPNKRCIGIDLGTTNSCIGVWQNDTVTIISNEFGQLTTPSVVWFPPKNGEPIVGKNAVARLSRAPNRTVYGVKRLIGQSFSEHWAKSMNYQVVCDERGNNLIRLSDKHLYPEQVSSEILKKMKTIAENYLGELVSEAVITVPAYFNDRQRYATKVAAELAGLEVTRMINEPTAACLCYGIDKLEEDCHVLVYDLGGGTLDVSLVYMSDGLFEVLATNGDCELGGIDFDMALVNHFLTGDVESIALNNGQLNRLRDGCEQLKIQLSNCETASFLLENFFEPEQKTKLSASNFCEIEEDVACTDWNLELTIQQWNEIVTLLIEKAKVPVLQVIKDGGIEKEEIEQIILVGGSTRIKAIQEMLVSLFPGKKLNKTINPDEAIAYGATIQSAILGVKDDQSKVKEMVLVDVTPLSLGIETEGGVMSVIVPRNTSIPCVKKAYYTTTENNQTEVLVEIFQGERKLTSENKLLGKFRLTGIPPSVRGIPKIRVEFNISADGILTITGLDEISNRQQIVTIDNSNTRIDKEEILRLLREAETNRADDEKRRLQIEEFNKARERLRELELILEDKRAPINHSCYEELRLKLNYFQTCLSGLKEGATIEKLMDFNDEIEKNLCKQFNQLFQIEFKIVSGDDDEFKPVKEPTISIDELNSYLSKMF